MNTVFVAVLFLCVPTNCIFATTPQQIYKSEAQCNTEISKLTQEFVTEIPNGVAQSICIKVTVGET